MSYIDKTYIIFDGDKDIWAYRRMKGWKALKNIDFDFEDAHGEYTLTNRATGEAYVKSKLKKRFATACQVIIIIGESTRYLYQYVRWEIEVAQELGLPIIAVNLNNLRTQDNERCPPLIRGRYVVHIPFRMRIIKYALDNFPSEFRKQGKTSSGPREYDNSVYQKLGLNDS